MSDVNIGKTHPAVYRAMADFGAKAETAATESGLEPRLVELVKIRASQINGCAYCLRMHVKDAIAVGETQERLAVLAAWWESQYFSGQEQAALQLAEQITRIDLPASHTDRRVDISGSLTDDQIAAVTWVVIAINSWNRVAIRSHYRVAPST